MTEKRTQSNGALLAPTQKTAGGAFTLAVFLSFLLSLLLTVAAQIVAKGDADAIERLTKKNVFIWISYFLSQAGFLLAAFLAVRLSSARVQTLYPLQKTHPLCYLAAVLTAFGLLFGLGNVNALFLEGLNKLGYVLPNANLPVMTDFGSYLVTLLCIAVLPAFAEETLFRGAMCAGLSEVKPWVAVLLSGVFFSLFHQNPAQTPYQFLCGAIFCIALYRTRNILIPMLMHFLNNAYVLTAGYLGIPDPSGTGNLILTLSGLCALSVGIFLFYKKGRASAPEAPQSPKQFLLYGGAGLAGCAVIWVANLLTGMGG